jgi:hypothetical protein
LSTFFRSVIRSNLSALPFSRVSSLRHCPTIVRTSVSYACAVCHVTSHFVIC